ncbi:hypothetical protein ACWEWQ_40635, partial [Streptomyces sp. NPDC003832]
MNGLDGSGATPVNRQHHNGRQLGKLRDLVQAADGGHPESEGIAVPEERPPSNSRTPNSPRTNRTPLHPEQHIPPRQHPQPTHINRPQHQRLNHHHRNTHSIS